MRHAAPDNRPENEILVGTARVPMEPERAGQIRALLRKEIAWDSLLGTAQGHGLLPLLYWHLSRTCSDAVPEATLAELRDRFRRNAARNLFLAGELLRLLKRFQEEGIGAIPFKGPTLAVLAYGNLALRTFEDLDLLLPKADVPRARELLAAQGYRLALRLSGGQQDAHLRSIGQLSFRSGDGRSAVDLHAEVMPPGFFFPLDPDALGERLQPVWVAGKAIPTFCPEVLLVLLCAHGAKHLWSRLAWVCDVAELIRAHPRMDWERVLGWATALRSMRLLFLGLLLASDLLEASLPPPIGREVRADPVTRSLAAQVRRQLFRQADGPPGGFASWIFHLKARERLRDGFRYSLGLSLTPTVADWMSLSLPAPLGWAYYLVRPARLAAKYSGKLLQRLR